MKTQIIAAMAALSTCAVASSAQAQSGVTFEAGATQLYDITGAELALDIALQQGQCG